MNKGIAVIIIFVSVFSTGYTQREVLRSWGFGVHGGTNFSTVTFDPSVKEKSIQGLNGGVFVNYKSLEHVGIQLEFNYSQKGWTEKPENAEPYTRKMEYYEIAALSHIVPGFGNFKAIINLGPFYGKHLGSESEGKVYNTQTDSAFIQYFHRGEEIDNKHDFGIILGLGFGYETPIGRFQVQGRLVQSLNRIYEKKPVGRFDGSVSSVLQVNAGYVFIIRAKRPVVYKKKLSEEDL